MLHDAGRTMCNPDAEGPVLARSQWLIWDRQGMAFFVVQTLCGVVKLGTTEKAGSPTFALEFAMQRQHLRAHPTGLCVVKDRPHLADLLDHRDGRVFDDPEFTKVLPANN